MLEQNPFFKELTAVQISVLEQSARREQIPKNTVVFHEGDRSENLYYILKGSAKAIRQNGGGRQVIVNHFGPDDCFGEMSFLDGATRCATVVTREACDVLILRRQAFLKLASSDPKIYQTITAFLLDKLRLATQQIEDLAIANVMTRLARILTEYQGTDGVLREPFTQQELAEMTGATRETICRLINYLIAEGYLSRRANYLRVQKKLSYSWE